MKSRPHRQQCRCQFPAISVKVPSAFCEWDNAEGSSQAGNPVETVRRPPTNDRGEDTVRSRQQWREADRDARLARPKWSGQYSVTNPRKQQNVDTPLVLAVNNGH